MEFKYRNAETVEAKEDFQIYTHDENGEVCGTKTVPKGTIGEVDSMHYSNNEPPEPYYNINFTIDGEELYIALFETSIEELFIVK